MYTVDERDEVVRLEDIPQSSIGAPCPILLASEHKLVVAYFLQNTPDDWDGTNVRVMGLNTNEEPAAIVRFSSPLDSLFGGPCKDTFSEHPLASRGLKPYGAFEVKESSWIRYLERRNSVCRDHQLEVFFSRRHFVLSFHDSTFECVAKRYSYELTSGPLTQLIAQEAMRLD